MDVMVRALWLVLVVSAPVSAAALEHPPILGEQRGCTDWVGTAHGNDPSVRLHLQICEAGGTVTGRAQWSSLTSGWNVRVLEGTRTGERFVLRDVRIAESRPAPGWWFCPIDRWTLERRGDQLEGRYESRSCDDRARVLLRRHGPPAPGRPAGGAEAEDSPPERRRRLTGQPDRPGHEEAPGAAQVGRLALEPAATSRQ